MKTILSFITFISAIFLASVGISKDSFLSNQSKNLALIAGLFFAVITVLTVLSNARNDYLNKNK